MFEHPVLAGFYRRFGPAPFLPHGAPREEPFKVLAESIVAQQLSGKAAAAISARLWSRVEPHPEALLQVSPATLRQTGLSHAKAQALRDLAARSLEGLLDGLDSLEDEAVKERLLQVRGIGPWTVDMFLMFGLRRPDVWPVGNLGLRRAAKALFDVEALELPAFGEPFRPYRSHLAWYLWRTLD